MEILFLPRAAGMLGLCFVDVRTSTLQAGHLLDSASRPLLRSLLRRENPIEILYVRGNLHASTIAALTRHQRLSVDVSLTHAVDDSTVSFAQVPPGAFGHAGLFIATRAQRDQLQRLLAAAAQAADPDAPNALPAALRGALRAHPMTASAIYLAARHLQSAGVAAQVKVP